MASRKPTLDSLITHLLQEASSTCQETHGLEWEWKHYTKLYDIVQQIQEKEAARDSTDDDPSWSSDMERRKANLPAFIGWLEENGIFKDKVEIVPVHSSGTGSGEFDGFGVVTNRKIQKAELVFEIPEKLMITTKVARESKLAILATKDHLLRSMDNVLLSIFLLYEKYVSRDASFWKPYIDILPKSYDTTVYFKPHEMKLLMQSPSGFRESLKMYRNIARQYSYFHTVFRKATDSGSRALKNIFTFKRYAWACSSVITRQNIVPRPSNMPDDLSLVPLWDLCNHQENSDLSTDYNVQEQRLVCYASQDYDPGEEFKIFYGHRSSLEYFIHGGFVPQSHYSDFYTLELGISKKDPNFLRKNTILEGLGLQHQLAFKVKPDKISQSRSLFVFVRIFLADKEFLEKVENEEGEYDYLGVPTEQAWKFLATRFTLLKQSTENNMNKLLKMIFEEYKIVSQDEKQLSARQLMILQLFKNEKKLLDILAICCNDHLSHLLKQTDAEN